MNFQALVVGALAALALVAGSFMAGRWTAPQPAPITAAEPTLAAIRQVVVTKYVDRVVTKTVHVVEEKKPDGTTTTTTDEKDNTSEKTAEVPPPPSQLAPILTAVQPTIAPNAQRQWRAAAGLTFSWTNGTSIGYSLEVDHRLIGPAWAGLHIDTHGLVGVNVGVEF